MEVAIVVWGSIAVLILVLGFTYMFITEMMSDNAGMEILVAGCVSLLLIWSGVVVFGLSIVNYEKAPCEKVEFNETEYVPVSCVVEWDES